MTNTDDHIPKRKRRWEWAGLALEIASLVGGALVIWGLYIEGLPALGSKLVLAGVAIEVAFGWCVLVASRKLQNILEGEFETLRLESAEANQRAAEAVTRGKEAEAHAADAQREAAQSNRISIQAQKALETERAARLKIEAQLAPRRITKSQESLIVRWMSSYKDAPLRTTTMIDIAVYANDNEAADLARQIWHAFGDAGCKTTFVGLDKMARVPIGILVEYRDKPTEPNNGQWRNIAGGVVNTLRHTNLLVSPAAPFEHPDPATEHLDSPVCVTVGRR